MISIKKAIRRIMMIKNAVLLYLILSTIIIFFFAVVYYMNGYVRTTLGDTVKTLRDCFYFSAISYFTIGYGDMSPVFTGKTLVIVEGFISNIINVVLLGYIFHSYMTRPKDIRWGKNLCLRYNTNDTFSLIVRMGNMGNKISDACFKIEMHSIENNIRKTKACISESMSIFGLSRYSGGPINDNKEAIKFIQKAIKTKSSLRGFRCILTGIDMKTGNSIVVYKTYSYKDIVIIKGFKNTYNWETTYSHSKMNWRDFDKIIELDENLKKRFFDMYRENDE